MTEEKLVSLVNEMFAKHTYGKAEIRAACRERGYESLGEYVAGVADDYGISYEGAWMAFSMLGPGEAFDGFVTTLEDEGEMLNEL